MIQEVKFQGLSHSPSDYEAQDGELGTCLNLICEDGALHPIHQPEVAESNITLASGDSIELVHKVTHSGEIHSHYIVKTSSNTWYWLEKGGDGTKTTISLGGFSVNAVATVGNIVCFVGENKTLYAYWQDTEYRVMDFTKISYSGTIQKISGPTTYDVVEVSETDCNVGGYVLGKNFTLAFPDTLTAANAHKYFLQKDAALNKKMDDESFKYIQFGVLALKLYDGSYLRVGNPFTITNGSGTFNDIYLWIDTDDQQFLDSGSRTLSTSGWKEYAILLRQYLYKFKLTINFTDISKYKDIISGIDVFVSNSIYPYKTNVEITKEQLKAGDGYDSSEKLYASTEDYGSLRFWYSAHSLVGTEVIGHWQYPALTAKEFDEEVGKLSFYKSISFTYDEIVSGETKTLKRIYQTEETLSLADGQQASYGAKVATTYNSRLHLGNVNVCNHNAINGNVSSSSTKAEVVTIAKYKYNGQSTLSYTISELGYPFDPFVSFPSDYVVEFCQYIKTSGGACRKRTYNVSTENNLGISYFLNYKDGGLNTIGVADMDYIDPTIYSYIYNKASNYTAKGANVSSLVKVSEAENPLVFPAKNSVQVGSSNINALAANTQPISEGQFGDAPLYAFTDEGVWVLMLGTEGTYAARQPANREICSNPSGILQIDDAILYPTERGIIMQRGRTSECITDQLEGYPFRFPYMDIRGTATSKVLAVGSISESSVKYVRLRTFLQNANMVYDYYDNRIVLFNPSYAYAYVYSLKSKLWGTMQNTLSKRVNIYPESYAVNSSGQIVNLYVQNPIYDVPYFLCSRPMGLGMPEVHKTMFTCIARGYFPSTKGTCGMLLFGSNDLQKWYYISSSVDKYLRGMAGTPYKYFRIALVGSLSPEESISGLSTDFQQRWQNKLR